jgi:hypothetical protein
MLRLALSLAYQKGFRITFIVGAVLNALVSVAAWFVMLQVAPARVDDEKLKEGGRKWDVEKSKDQEQACMIRVNVIRVKVCNTLQCPAP